MDSFICGVCGMEFHDIVEFVEHKKNLGTYSCSQCNALFHDELDALRHTRMEHVPADDILVPALEEVVGSGYEPQDPSAEHASQIEMNVQEKGKFTAVGDFGDLTLIPCGNGDVTFLGNVQIAVQSDAPSQALLTLASVESKDGTDQNLVTLQLEEPAESAHEVEQAANSTVVLMQETFDETPCAAEKRKNKTVEKSSDASSITSEAAIFACVKCQCFATSNESILEHLKTVHHVTVESKDVDQLAIQLKPLTNSQHHEEVSQVKDTLRIMASNNNEAYADKGIVQLLVEPPPANGSHNGRGPPKTGRKRGRPRKTDAQKSQNKTPAAAIGDENASLNHADKEPVQSEDGLYHCSRCKRAFTKTRHILVHRCMASGDYVDPSVQESFASVTADETEMDAEELEEKELDTDNTVDFRLYKSKFRGHKQRGRRRGRPRIRMLGQKPSFKKAFVTALEVGDANSEQQSGEGKASLPSNPNDANDQVRCEDSGTAIHKETSGDYGGSDFENDPSVKIALAKSKLNWRDDPHHVPVFSTDEERICFEEQLNSVDLSSMDDLFTRHEVQQELDTRQLNKVCIRENLELIVYSCNVCKKVFKSLSHMRLHCLVHTDLKPFHCPKCSYRSNAKGSMYAHMRWHTGNFFRCSKCDFKTCNRSHLTEHEATHERAHYICKMCQNSYSTIKSLMNHVRRYHTGPSGKKYLASFLVRSPHMTAILHTCHVCNRRFKKKVDRDRHLFIHSTKDVASALRCRLCSYAAPRRSYLENHLRKHRVVYVCTVCEKTFLSSILLRKHLQEHLRTSGSKENCAKSNCSEDKGISSQNEPAGFTENIRNISGNFSSEISKGKVTNLCSNFNFPSESVSVTEISSKEVRSQQAHVNDIKKEAETSCLSEGSPNSQSQVRNNNLAMPENLHKNMDDLFDASICKSWYLPEPEGSLGPNSAYTYVPGELTNSAVTQADGANNEKECSISQPSFNTFSSIEYKPLNLHLYTKMQAAFGHAECETCGRLFHSHATLEPHLLTHSKDKPFKCTECSYSACTKDNLRRHQESVHEGKSFSCNVCEFKARSRTSLWHHKQRHAHTECLICKAKFSSIHKLREHVSSSHPPASKEYVSQLSGGPLRVVGRLGRRSYKCPYCDKIFHRSSTDLQKHMWIHEGVKPFKCPLCSHTCRSQNNLNVHMLRHSQEKPHLCEECGKSYKSKSALRCHMRLHSLHYPPTLPSDANASKDTQQSQKYACQWCDYKSNNYVYMKVHQLRRHQNTAKKPRNNLKSTPVEAEAAKSAEQMFKCMTCEFVFNSIAEVKEHLQVHHGLNISSLELNDLPELVVGEATNEADTQEAPTKDTTDVLMTAVVTDAQSSVIIAPPTTVTSAGNDPAMPQTQLINTGSSESSLYHVASDLSPSEIDEKMASAVNIVQQIFQQGAFESQMLQVHPMGGDENFLTVNPETIIVQDGDREVVLKGTPDGQYVVECIRDATSQAGIVGEQTSEASLVPNMPNISIEATNDGETIIAADASAAMAQQDETHNGEMAGPSHVQTVVLEMASHLNGNDVEMTSQQCQSTNLDCSVAQNNVAETQMVIEENSVATNFVENSLPIM